MLSESYTIPRLAACYDALNPPAPEWDFFLGLAGAAPKTILEVGCGTGALACQFARNGHCVTGADPAAAMLDIARNRTDGEKTTWVLSDAASLRLNDKFDLIFMTGHVFQLFLRDEDVLAVLRNLRAHLAPGGQIAFETRNPLRREWEEWTFDNDRHQITVPGLGAVDVCYDTVSVRGQLVTYNIHFQFKGEASIIVNDTLRFITQEELAALLSQAGFKTVSWFGDWDRSPVSPQSPEIIVVAHA